MITRVRRALVRSLPRQGIGGWLARQPLWRLALLYWLCFVAVVGGAMLAVTASMHGSVPVFVWPLLLVGGVIPAGLVAVQLRETCRR
jgi:hypothetical protein